MKPQLDPARALMTLRALNVDTVASVRAEREVGVQRNTQDFRGSVVQRGLRVVDSYLRVKP